MFLYVGGTVGSKVVGPLVGVPLPPWWQKGLTAGIMGTHETGGQTFCLAASRGLVPLQPGRLGAV